MFKDIGVQFSDNSRLSFLNIQTLNKEGLRRESRSKSWEFQTSTAPKTGADLLIDLLINEGVETLFGYPGGAVLPIYDAIYRAQGNIKHVLFRHEQGSIHAAEGYARITGKPGVVIATSGPGATNLVTGITDAMMDSLPLVIFTGQVARTSSEQMPFRKQMLWQSRHLLRNIIIRCNRLLTYQESSRKHFILLLPAGQDQY